VQRPKEQARLGLGPEEAEVAAHHQHRVEDAQPAVDSGKGQKSDVDDATPTCDLNGAGRDVDRDHPAPSPLRFQAVPSGTASDVEDSPLHPFEHLLFFRRPLIERAEEHGRRKRRLRGAVVAFEDRLASSTREVIDEKLTEGVLTSIERHASILAGSVPRKAANR
jgi:hypothetical protein